jgi:hypothetical protein
LDSSTSAIVKVLRETLDSLLADADDGGIEQVELRSLDPEIADSWCSRLTARLGVEVPTALLRESQNFEDFAERVRGLECETLDATDLFELTPAQRMYQNREPGHLYLELDGEDIKPTRLDRAIREVMKIHGMLRARVSPDGTQWISRSGIWQGLVTHDFTGDDRPAVQRNLMELRELLASTRLDVASQQVFDVVLSMLPDKGNRVHFKFNLVQPRRSRRGERLESDLGSRQGLLRAAGSHVHFSLDFPSYLRKCEFTNVGEDVSWNVSYRKDNAEWTTITLWPT